MKMFLNALAMFTATVFFLSIEISDRPIFDHIYKRISPLTQATQDKAESFFNGTVNSTHKVSKKFFENSTPKVNDAVKSKMSSIKKAAPLDHVDAKDKKELDALIKSHR